MELFRLLMNKSKPFKLWFWPQPENSPNKPPEYSNLLVNIWKSSATSVLEEPRFLKILSLSRVEFKSLSELQEEFKIWLTEKNLKSRILKFWFLMRLIKCSIRDLRTKWPKSLVLYQVIFRLDYTLPPCQKTSCKLQMILWETQLLLESRMKTSLWMVSSNSSLPSNKNHGSTPPWRNSTRTLKSNKLLSTLIRRLMLTISPNNSRMMDSHWKWCMDKLLKKKEMRSWKSLERVISEYW